MEKVPTTKIEKGFMKYPRFTFSLMCLIVAIISWISPVSNELRQTVFLAVIVALIAYIADRQK
jgi:hypothetical protein